MEYFEIQVPDGNGRCSDIECPCPEPGMVIPRGTGYLYISHEAVSFRRDCPSLQQFREKMTRIQNKSTFQVFASPELIAPLLVCEESARRRELDLEVAASDAKHWWETGQVPLRSTPLISQVDRATFSTRPELSSELLDANSLYHRGIDHSGKLEHQEAVWYFSEAIKQDPSHTPSLIDLTFAYIQCDYPGDYVIQYLSKLLEIQTDHDLVLRLIAVIRPYAGKKQGLSSGEKIKVFKTVRSFPEETRRRQLILQLEEQRKLDKQHKQHPAIEELHTCIKCGTQSSKCRKYGFYYGRHISTTKVAFKTYETRYRIDGRKDAWLCRRCLVEATFFSPFSFIIMGLECMLLFMVASEGLSSFHYDVLSFLCFSIPFVFLTYVGYIITVGSGNIIGVCGDKEVIKAFRKELEGKGFTEFFHRGRYDRFKHSTKI